MELYLSIAKSINLHASKSPILNSVPCPVLCLHPV